MSRSNSESEREPSRALITVQSAISYALYTATYYTASIFVCMKGGRDNVRIFHGQIGTSKV